MRDQPSFSVLGHPSATFPWIFCLPSCPGPEDGNIGQPVKLIFLNFHFRKALFFMFCMEPSSSSPDKCSCGKYFDFKNKAFIGISLIFLPKLRALSWHIICEALCKQYLIIDTYLIVMAEVNGEHVQYKPQYMI